MDVVCPHPHPGTQTPENPGETSPSDLWVSSEVTPATLDAFGNLPLGEAATWSEALRGLYQMQRELAVWLVCSLGCNGVSTA